MMMSTIAKMSAVKGDVAPSMNRKILTSALAIRYVHYSEIVVEISTKHVMIRLLCHLLFTIMVISSV